MQDDFPRFSRTAYDRWKQASPPEKEIDEWERTWHVEGCPANFGELCECDLIEEEEEDELEEPG